MEQGLPAWGVCNLGAIVLDKFTNGWFDRPTGKTIFKNKQLEKHIRKELERFFDKKTAEMLLYHIKWEELEEVTRLGLQFQDAIIDATYYPFEENERNQKGERRVGLGIMALQDIMLYCGIRYGSKESEWFSDVLLGMIAEWCYLESVELAKENGPFPQFVCDKFLQSGYMKQMAKFKPHVVEEIRKHGVRNVTCLTIAPTGTTGTMLGVSTGAEPYFAYEYFRNSRLGQFMESCEIVNRYCEAHPEFQLLDEKGKRDYKRLPSFFVTSMDLTPEEHIRVQAALQKWIDSSISKTCNAPNDYTVENVTNLYDLAYELGCKGVTIYRDGSRDVQVLETKKETSAEEAVIADIAKVVEEAVEEHKAYTKVKRPDVLYGATYKKNTPHGQVYITINDDPDNKLAREVFVNIGKAGSDLFASNEALGRMITLYLKDSPNPNKEGALVKHLSGIGGQNSVGFGPNRISSVPDAIAKAFIQHAETRSVRQVTSESVAHETEETKEKGLGQYAVQRDICPQCQELTLIKHGGCNECTSCGYSKC